MDKTREIVELVNRMVEEFELDLRAMPNPSLGYLKFLHNSLTGKKLSYDKTMMCYSRETVMQYLYEIMTKIIGIDTKKAEKYIGKI